MPTSWRTRNEGTLQSSARDAISLVKLEKETHGLTLWIWKENWSRPTSFRSSRDPKQSALVIVIGEIKYSLLLPTERTKQKRVSLYVRQKKKKKTTTAATPISEQQQTPIIVKNDKDYCRLLLTEAYQAEKCRFCRSEQSFYNSVRIRRATSLSTEISDHGLEGHIVVFQLVLCNALQRME